jgi:hypothetical protein
MLSHSKLEGLNAKTRLINHRGYGHHSAAALIAMITSVVAGSPSSCRRRGRDEREFHPRKPEENPFSP